MSHFSVAVITKNMPTNKEIFEILAPYCESYSIYSKDAFEFVDCTEELEVELKNPPSPKIKTIEDLAEYHGYVYNESRNAYGYYENPQARWDWFFIGGRFSGLLYVPEDVPTVFDYTISFDDYQRTPKYFKGVKIKPATSAQIKHVLNWYDEDVYECSYKLFKDWEKNVAAGLGCSLEEFPIELCVCKPEYIYSKYKNAENYAKARSLLGTYAIVKNGEWIAPGKVGWFLTSSAAPEDELEFMLRFKDILMEGIDEDYYITIVDCHI